MSSLPSSYLELTQKERIYVDSRLQGLTKVASAAAAGYSYPKNDCTRIEKSDKVQAAMVAMMERTADEVGFTRREAHDMYMEAYRNAETATEQIAAVTAMVKLHGLEAPKQVEIKHDHRHEVEMRYMDTNELMKLANMDGELVLEGEYEEIGEKPVLEAPPVTEDNLEHPEALSPTPEDY